MSQNYITVSDAAVAAAGRIQSVSRYFSGVSVNLTSEMGKSSVNPGKVGSMLTNMRRTLDSIHAELDVIGDDIGSDE